MSVSRANHLYTIGHSDRTIEQFIGLLKAHGIKQIVDIRSIPKSRHNPQFNKKELAVSLRNKRIGYRHMKDLGGLRHPKKDSVNSGWEDLSFRGFADYMQTTGFYRAVDQLKKIAQKKKTAVICA